MKDRFIRVTLVLAAVAAAVLITWRVLLWEKQGTYREALVKPTSSEGEGEPPKKLFVVERVIDGDTLVLANGETVRLIGVDAPETNRPEIPVQRFGKEATAFLQRMVEGLEVSLEYDGQGKDAYGRTLAYVFVNGTCVNKEVIRRGYGYADTRFPHSRQNEFIEAEQEARAKHYGLWDYSLRDGRIANLVDRYEQLSPEGKKQLEKTWDELLLKYPAPSVKEKGDD